MIQTNLKHIVGLLLFIVGFSLSVMLVNALSVKQTLPVVNDGVLIEQPRVSSYYSQTQRNMLLFLERDRQHGRELSNDLATIKGENRLFNEELATSNLVVKMGAAYYEDFPPDFQTAWKIHLLAWRERDNFLHRSKQNGNNTFINQNLASDYARQSRKIHDTYVDLLRSAKQHGVEFSY